MWRWQEVAVGDTLVIYPHDICPVDGVVIEGHGVMDESYLTGEPFQITKTSGSTVISGAINGESALTIRATQRAADSRYAKIMEVMRESEAKRPQLRRLGDQLGRDLHAGGAGGRASSPGRISGEADSLPRGAGDRHAVSAAASPFRSPSSVRFPSAPAAPSSSRAPSCSSRSPSVAPRSSTRPAR